MQAKRLHEYKRQLLCALYIYDLYRRIKTEGLEMHPHTFIFGAKASAGYVMAKEIIRFICALGDLINNDPAIHDVLKVVFLADYKVGDDNMFLFGLTTPEVVRWKRDGYHPDQLYRNDPHLRALLDSILKNGIAGKNFESIVRYLIGPDPYMVLADFNAYCNAQKKLDDAYLDTQRWNRMSLVNIAKAGIFASDRAVKEYANNIWHLRPVE